MEAQNLNFQITGISMAGAPIQGPVEGSRPGELQGSGASEEATGREPKSVNLEGLALWVCRDAKRNGSGLPSGVRVGLGWRWPVTRLRGRRAGNRNSKVLQVRLSQGNL
jgi:hypothetical protein